MRISWSQGSSLRSLLLGGMLTGGAPLTWDPTQPIATRPLSICKDGTWYAYGWDLTKNVCEVYGQHGYIRTAYTYSPYGEVTADGDDTQPIQWSSEHNDTELALVYYNYRHYNPLNGRWIGRDRIGEVEDYNLYSKMQNRIAHSIDILGMYEYYDRWQFVYDSTPVHTHFYASNTFILISQLLKHLYTGNAKKVSFDLTLLEKTETTYSKEIKSYVHNGFYEMKALKYFNIRKYTNASRFVGRGVENYILGDYSLSASFLLKTDKKTKCIKSFEVEMLLEDQFNVSQRKNPDNKMRLSFRNSFAFVMNIPSNRSFIVNAKKAYSYNVKNEQIIIT